MSQGPSLIFDKSALESLNLDEAVFLDNFYRSNITPLFFIECLADLEKAIRSRSTPELLRNIKQSHQIDLAYLHYLPFCSVFTSKDRFHVQTVPLFLNQRQTFVYGEEMKQDLSRLVELYSNMPDEVLRTGLFNFAQQPPEDTSYLVTRLWDRYLPFWRGFKQQPQDSRDPEADRKIVEEINTWVDGGPGIQSHDEDDVDRLDHVIISRRVMPR